MFFFSSSNTLFLETLCSWNNLAAKEKNVAACWTVSLTGLALAGHGATIYRAFLWRLEVLMALVTPES